MQADAKNLTFNQNRSGLSPPAEARWPDIALILILILLPWLFFWRAVTPNPTDRLHITTGDFTEQYFPLRAFAAYEWVQGRVPLWDPYLYGGQPALADIQSGALYPLHIIEALLLGWGGPLWGQEVGFPLWALEIQVIAHFSLAAVGCYLFVRHLGRRAGRSLQRARFGGVIAALVFTFSGYLTGFPVQQMTILEVSAWLPWVMWGLSQTEGRGEKGKKVVVAVVGSGLAFGMAILAGHPQTVLYIFYLTLAYTVFQTIYIWKKPTRTGFSGILLDTIHNMQYVALWLCLILLGVAISAAQLLPTLEFIRHSVRADMAYQAVSSGLPLNELVSVVYPGFLGGSPEYVGIVTLVLIGAALIVGRPRREVFFWAGAGLVSLLLAFGGNTFLYALFYLAVPGFGVVRQQERVFLVYSLSAAVLAAYGTIAVTSPLSATMRRGYVHFEQALRIISIVGVILVGIFIYGSARATARGDEVNLFFGVLRHHLFGLIILAGMLTWLGLRPRRWLGRAWAMGLLAGWTVFNLFSVNWQFNLQARQVEPFASNGVTQFLQTHLSTPGRVVSGGRLPGGHSAAAVYHLEDLTGNTPLQLAAADIFLQQMPSWRMWQLMNVRYVVDNRDLTGPGLTPVFEEGDLKVFEVSDPFPRAWLVGQTEVVIDDNQAITRLANDNFDLRRVAIVAAPVEMPLADPSTSTVTVVETSSAHLEAQVQTTGNHLVVFSQIYYPGWQATLDGQPVEVKRVNVVQQGVLVPPGNHVLELSFQPVSFWWGMAISVTGILVDLVLLGWGIVKK